MDTGVVTVQMMQEGSDVLYVFTDNDNPSDQMVLPADGKIYQDGNYSYQGACKDNKLYTVEKGTDKEYGPYTINSVYSLNSNNSLDLDITISLQGQSIPFKEVCTRL
jgi:hypothetical protein